jgi:glycosyltransferase involved in cell wall biosynthesis
MRLGVVTTSFPEREGALAGSFVLETCRALVELGHEIEVVAPDPGRGQPPRWPGITVRWARYTIPRRAQALAYGAGIPDNLRRRPWLASQAPALTMALSREVRRRRTGWDGLISHWLLPCGLIAAALRSGRPHVAVAHSADVWLLRTLPAGRLVYRTLAAGADRVAAVSPLLVAELAELASADVASPVLLPLGPSRLPEPDADESARLRQMIRERWGSQTLLVAVIARLVPVKGVDILLEALARPEARGIAALIAGEGPERARLEARAVALGVQAAFLGTVDARQRSSLLAMADALVIPSVELASGRSEGAPVVAVEGLAAGLPVIASRVGGLPWSVGKAGLLVEPGDAGELARVLARLRDEPELRRELSDAARRKARSFGWGAAARRLEALLRRDE